jgi:hypothetical protein
MNKIKLIIMGLVALGIGQVQAQKVQQTPESHATNPQKTEWFVSSVYDWNNRSPISVVRWSRTIEPNGDITISAYYDLSGGAPTANTATLQTTARCQVTGDVSV